MKRNRFPDVEKSHAENSRLLRAEIFLFFLSFGFCGMFARTTGNEVFQKHKGWSTPYYYYLKKKPLNVLNQYFFKAQTHDKIVALTFDDGYLPNTQNVMNYLKTNKIPATFFVLMGSKFMTAELFKKYDDPLFEIGMHSFFHDDYRKASHARIEQDINYCIRRATERIPGKKIRYFRPPYGVVDNYATELLKKNNLLGILWSTDSKDWAGLKGQALVDNVMANAGEGSIILMHDGISVQTLDMLCKELKKQGYQIVSMSKIVSYKNEFPLSE